jgi:predicted  nucleic acid-binding Zn-ribbon protein
VVLASAVCAIGWGVINAIFIKSVDMGDIEVIRSAIAEGEAAKKANADPEAAAINAEDSDEAAADADEVLAKLTQVGDLITTGAI